MRRNTLDVNRLWRIKTSGLAVQPWENGLTSLRQESQTNRVNSRVVMQREQSFARVPFSKGCWEHGGLCKPISSPLALQCWLPQYLYHVLVTSHQVLAEGKRQ